MSRASVLNYHHAELLFHVLRARTLTDAANAMHISQPAVTKQLRSLEEGLGVQLFKKEGRKLVPTVEALLLAEEVERTQASLTSLNELAMRLRSGVAGKLSVCAIPALSQVLLPETIGSFRRTHPNIHVEVKVENSWRVLDLAESQQIDIGICFAYRKSRQIEDTTLLRSHVVCIVRHDDAFAGGTEMRLPELRGRPVVMVEVYDSDADLKAALNMCGLDRDIVCRVSTSTLACEIVLRTGGIALVDSLTAAAYQSRGIAIVQLPDLPARSVSLLRPRLRPVSIFADAFVRALLLEASKFEAAST